MYGQAGGLQVVYRDVSTHHNLRANLKTQDSGSVNAICSHRLHIIAGKPDAKHFCHIYVKVCVCEFEFGCASVLSVVVLAYERQSKGNKV